MERRASAPVPDDEKDTEAAAPEDRPTLDNRQKGSDSVSLLLTFLTPRTLPRQGHSP